MIDPLQSVITAFFQANQVEPKRVFHGRGQIFPEYSHVCLDWYPPVVFISAYEVVENISEILSWLQSLVEFNQIETIMSQKRYEKPYILKCCIERL